MIFVSQFTNDKSLILTGHYSKSKKSPEPHAFVLVLLVKWLKRYFSSELPFFQHSQPPYSLNPTTILTL